MAHAVSPLIKREEIVNLVSKQRMKNHKQQNTAGQNAFPENSQPEKKSSKQEEKEAAKATKKERRKEKNRAKRQAYRSRKREKKFTAKKDRYEWTKQKAETEKQGKKTRRQSKENKDNSSKEQKERRRYLRHAKRGDGMAWEELMKIAWTECDFDTMQTLFIMDLFRSAPGTTKRFRVLSSRYHPDKHLAGSANGESSIECYKTAFQALNEAHNVVKQMN